MTVLIITNEQDATSDAVVDRLDELGVPAFRLNTERLGDYFSFALSFDGGHFSGHFDSKHRVLDMSAVTSVYYRRPEYPPLEQLSHEDREFAVQEIRAFLRWLWYDLSHCFWISKPHQIRKAESKINQLRIAQSLGFRVPRTLITNKPDAVTKFFEACGGEMITKTLSRGYVYRDGRRFHIYTNRVTQDHLAKLDGVSLVPCLFQQRVDKSVEVRVTVVGTKVFATEIQSQKSERTKDDWRRYDFENTPHVIHFLPREIEAACASLVSWYDLEFGAIDLILSPDSEYFFLELNPNGQWLWLEHLTGLPILDTLVSALATGKRT